MEQKGNQPKILEIFLGFQRKFCLTSFFKKNQGEHKLGNDPSKSES